MNCWGHNFYRVWVMWGAGEAAGLSRARQDNRGGWSEVLVWDLSTWRPLWGRLKC